VTRVLVCGDVINDVVAAPLAAPVPDDDTPAVISLSPGGSAANQAAWLGYLGVDVVFAGRAGADDAEFHRRELARFGVSPRITADPGAQTGQIVVLVEPGGERTMITDRGANARLSPSDVPLELLDGLDLLLLSGYLFASPGPREVALSLIAAARSRGTAFAIDPGSAAALEGFPRWTRGAAVCFPNRDEGFALTGSTSPEAMAARLADWYELVVLKLGAEGALVAGATGVERVAANRVAGAIDSTGAGDAFTAAFLVDWLTGADPVEAARRAVAVAARALVIRGGRPPSR
jgi:sugar/nucleoside kinase (ribokinase family)